MENGEWRMENGEWNWWEFEPARSLAIRTNSVLPPELPAAEI